MRAEVMTMLRELSWSDQDWDLIVELLQREMNELPSEIHHTSTSEYREALRERRAQITRILDRLRSSRGQALPQGRCL